MNHDRTSILDAAFSDAVRDGDLARVRLGLFGRPLTLAFHEERPGTTPPAADVLVRWMRRPGGATTSSVVLGAGSGLDGTRAFRPEGPADRPGPLPTRGLDDPDNWHSLIRHPALLGLVAASSCQPSHMMISTAGIPPFRSDAERRIWYDVARGLHDEGTSIKSTALATEAGSRPSIEASTRSAILSINPNADSTQFGHFLGFDRQLRRLALREGTSLVTAAHLGLGDDPERRPWMIPWFSITTSYRHAGDPRAARPFLRVMADELRPLLEHLTLHFDDQRVFWYLGAAEYLPVVEVLCAEFPSVEWHVHLFWDFGLDTSDQSSLRRFREMVEPAAALDRVTLTLGTETLLDELDSAFPGHPFGLLPDGPSVIIPDEEAEQQLDCALARHRPQRLEVFCPGNHSIGKNWVIGAEVAIRLSERFGDRFRTTVRFLRERTSAEQRSRLDRLQDADHVRLIEGLPSDAELLTLLEEADVVFLPYSPDWFRHRSSGLLTEAVLCGCRVVCLDDTYLAWVTRSAEIGSSLTETSDIDAFVDAIAAEAERARGDRIMERDARIARWKATSWETIHASLHRPIR